MSTLLKKFILSFLSFLVLFFSITPSFSIARAQTEPTWYNQDFKTWFSKVNDTENPSEIFGERYTSAQVQWVIYGLFSFILNSTTNADVLSCVFKNSADLNACASVISSIAGVTSNQSNPPPNQSLLSLVFDTNRPISGISYLKEKVSNFSIVPVAHAQTVGFGFSALQPIQNMWSGFRDISYGLFVLVAIVFSFMIMFRVKLSPQTVITVQSALPKIIISLILVTFSYAIAGFLIDFMYIVIGLISIVTAPFFPIVNPQPSNIFSLLTLGQPFGYDIQIGVFGLLVVFYTIFFLPLIVLILVLTALLAGVIPGAAPVIIIVGIVLVVVAVIVALWMGIRTIWALIKAFVNVLLLTIFAPLQIVLGNLVPSLGFGQWVKSYLSNLSVFVVTGVLFLFCFIFIIQGVAIAFTPSGTLTSAILKPLLGTISPILPAITFGSPWPPLLGAGNAQWTGLLFLGVAFVLFTMVPKATEIVQGLLSGKPFAYGTAVGEAFGPIKPIYGFGERAAINGAINFAKTNEDIFPDRGVGKYIRSIINEASRQQKIEYQSKGPNDIR